MKKTLHAYIRTADRFDVGLLHIFYHDGRLRGALLDPKREPILPTLSELEELFSVKESSQSLYAIESLSGERKGFAILKGISPEVLLGEAVLLFDSAVYCNEKEIPQTALEFIEKRAFIQLHLHKLMVMCLDEEWELKSFLKGHGYECEGVIRETVYTQGSWHDLEMWAKMNPHKGTDL